MRVTFEERDTKMNAESTVSTAVEIAAEVSAALLPAASQNEAQEVEIKVTDESDEALLNPGVYY